MLQGTPGRVREYYDEHPISEAHVLAALAGRGRADAPTADDLFAFDQDHYGGLSAVDSLARRARGGAPGRVLHPSAGGRGAPPPPRRPPPAPAPPPRLAPRRRPPRPPAHPRRPPSG